MTMRFTVANWHTRPVEYWLDQPYAYTIMVSPPDWAKQHGMNQPLFAATASEVFGNISQAEYTQRFQAMLQERKQLVEFFIHAHSKVNAHVILLCACPGRTIHERFCHRYLVADFLRSLGCEEVPLPVEESEPMEDIVVTVPLSFGLDTWIAEGDPAGAAWSGTEWHFYLGTMKPNIKPGGRVYVVYNGILRGYAPLVRVDVDYGSGEDQIRLGHSGPPRFALVRHGGAVAVTINERIPGFRGFRARWWKREDEKPFDYPWYDGVPAWQKPMEWERVALTERAGVVPAKATHLMGLALDGSPVAAYYKLAGVWHCTRCDETFPNAASVQEHIKASEDHIQRGVQNYQDYMARKRGAA